jgi:hypothetical protein
VRGVVADSELLLDDLRDAGKGPDRALATIGRGTPSEVEDPSEELSIGEFAGSARDALEGKTRLAVVAVDRPPPLDGLGTAWKGFGPSRGGETLVPESESGLLDLKGGIPAAGLASPVLSWLDRHHGDFLLPESLAPSTEEHGDPPGTVGRSAERATMDAIATPSQLEPSNRGSPK